MTVRPRLSPEVAKLRSAVREALAEAAPVRDSLVLVACSGGPDSLALAAAAAFVAPKLGLRAGAVIVDHGLQPDSAPVAARAAAACERLGLAPVEVRAVRVGKAGGLEAAARDARYRALDESAERLGAALVLLGHTLNDQAETVLLGLARGSGTRSLAGMAARNGRYLRPLLGITRAETEAACEWLGLEPWQDPHNSNPGFARVRVRSAVLPSLERELGPGIAEALARSAEILREDANHLDALAEAALNALLPATLEDRLELPVTPLTELPPAIRNRVLLLAAARLGGQLSRAQVLRVNELLHAWKGQGPLNLAGVRVERAGQGLVFSRGSAQRLRGK
jgi:tRNA(Ile)-lysidine synthase